MGKEELSELIHEYLDFTRGMEQADEFSVMTAETVLRPFAYWLMKSTSPQPTPTTKTLEDI